MIRFFFILLLIMLGFSCENNPKEIDPLFYQISTGDSIKYSKELHHLLMEEVLEYQELDFKIYSGIGLPPPYIVANILTIEFANNGDCIVEGEINKLPLSSVVFDFFIKNRNRSEGRYSISDTDALKFPFYHMLTVQEIKSKIIERKQDLAKLKKRKGIDPVLIEYYAESVNFEKERLELLRLFKTDSIAFLKELIFVEINRSDSETAYQKALDQAIQGYFDLRNYECLRYFGESYLNLFARAQQRKRPIDIAKLEGLKTLRPIQIKDYIRKRRIIIPPQEDI